MSLSMAMVGCGGMGLRHVYGYAELKKRFNGIRLTAVCDLHASSANHVAAEVELLTGDRPRVYTNFTQMLDEEPGLQAIDVTSDTRTHHSFAIAGLEAGLDVLVEKPMAVTVKACLRMIEASRKTGRVLSVAENYRRDPMIRLAKAVVDEGLIGTPRFMLKIGVNEATPCDVGWHKLKDYAGGVLIEQGAHEADLLLYFMGKVKSVMGETALFDPTRDFVDRTEKLSRYYEHRVEYVSSNTPTFTLEQDDTAFAQIRFESGAIAQYTLSNASSGYGISMDTVHGSEGTLTVPRCRSGKSPEARFGSDGARITDSELLEMLPDWELDDITANMWDGQRRMGSYDLSFEEADRKLIAIELQEFSHAISDGVKPEIDEIVGAEAVALAYAPLESSYAGKPVRMSDLIDGIDAGYQSSIDEGLGLQGAG